LLSELRLYSQRQTDDVGAACGSGSTFVNRNVDISRRLLGPLTIVSLKGRLPAEPEDFDAALLSTALCDMVNVGRLELVLNLRGLTYIDPRGLATLAMMTDIIHDAGGHVTLVAPSARVARMLAVTRLDSVVEWDEAGAVPA